MHTRTLSHTHIHTHILGTTHAPCGQILELVTSGVKSWKALEVHIPGRTGKQIRERLHKRLRLLKLLVTDPARYSAEKYAGSSAMYLSAVMPGTWREDVGLPGETKGSKTTEHQERA